MIGKEQRAKSKDKSYELPKPGATVPEVPELPINKRYYRPASSHLPLQEGESRILRLDPGNKDDKNISCSFVRASVDRPWNYEALSYLWGRATQRAKETLQSHQTKIPSTLYLTSEKCFRS